MKQLMRFSALILFLYFSLPCVLLQAQVTVGSGLHAAKGALLDLKQFDPSESEQGGATAQKGLLLPRVELTRNTTLEDVLQNYEGSEEELRLLHKGLLVYHVGNDVLLEGIYYWNGAEWLYLSSLTSHPPVIESMVCENVIIDKQELTANEPFETLLRIPYSGGNGAAYPQGEEINCQPATTEEPNLIQGLKIQLQPGVLALGSGNLVYKIWGTPDRNSPDIARFNVQFPNKYDLPDVNGDEYIECSVDIGNTSLAKVETFTMVGPLVPTTAGSDNNVPGYEIVITTPDGRWSVRAFVPKAGVNYNTTYGGSGTPTAGTCTFEEVDIQIRANNMNNIDRKIMWTLNLVYNANNYSGSNTLSIPSAASDIWGGSYYGSGEVGRNNGPTFYMTGPYTGLNANRCYQVCWANSNVFTGAYPENRIYTWTETANLGKKRTVYTLTFMMGVSETTSTTVTDELAKNSTVYFKMEQATTME